MAASQQGSYVTRDEFESLRSDVVDIRDDVVDLRLSMSKWDTGLVILKWVLTPVGLAILMGIGRILVKLG